MRVKPGDTVGAAELHTIKGVTVTLPDPEKIVHLQFRRFAGCPICNVHLQSVVKRYDEIAANGIREVVMFHSTPEELKTYVDDLPFDLVPDPDRTLYRRFGVETSVRSVADPRSVAPIFKGLVDPSLAGKLRLKAGMHRANGGHLGLPADILIDTDGTVIDAKYGKHAGDQWSVDDLLQRAKVRR
ncbi:AhpC/TSA family protein [Mycobacterium crocinum]|uniref:AhpC/TSA family protein n=1 Tax=Mycolicibacterium crocinum TaxID=388459 RepID=A0ABY3TFM7_9MYCO|nr:peroxiredoxin-like family protein [Mycolicibacterium crocinum]MCV7215160.1 AhpC/TSA family protein [Mycolicibacterium crocinum]ULN39091.1 AhpC/TSA family protein [Mycolicibacterium crocinum]